MAVSDIQGGAPTPTASTWSRSRRTLKATGSVLGAPGTRPLDPKGPLEVDCDILVPAALENQITLENVGRVKAALVVEAANGPTTPGADRILSERGIVVVPDILANAGGVVVSYFEWVQNLDNEQWDAHVVQERLQAKMQRAAEGVVSTYHHLRARLRRVPRALAQGGSRAPRTRSSPTCGWPPRRRRWAAAGPPWTSGASGRRPGAKEALSPASGRR